MNDHSYFSFLSKIFSRKGEETASDKPEGPKGVKLKGPTSMLSLTNGQIRRRDARRIAAQRRKATRRHRADWLASRQANSVLRGQLLVLDGQSFSPEYRDMIEAQVVRVHGSVEKAKAALV